MGNIPIKGRLMKIKLYFFKSMGGHLRTFFNWSKFKHLPVLVKEYWMVLIKE